MRLKIGLFIGGVVRFVAIVGAFGFYGMIGGVIGMVLSVVTGTAEIDAGWLVVGASALAFGAVGARQVARDL